LDIFIDNRIVNIKYILIRLYQLNLYG